MRLFQSKEKKQQADAARATYMEFARVAAESDPQQIGVLVETFKENRELDVLSEKERRTRSSGAFHTYAENVLADDRMTEDEESAFGEVAEALGIGQNDFETTYRDLLNRLVIARVNDGRLGVIAEPRLMTKKDEVVHLEANASLMKEVAVREWRGGSSGVSFRIARGVA